MICKTIIIAQEPLKGKLVTSMNLTTQTETRREQWAQPTTDEYEFLKTDNSSGRDERQTIKKWPMKVCMYEKKKKKEKVFQR